MFVGCRRDVPLVATVRCRVAAMCHGGGSSCMPHRVSVVMRAGRLVMLSGTMVRHSPRGVAMSVDGDLPDAQVVHLVDAGDLAEAAAQRIRIHAGGCGFQEDAAGFADQAEASAAVGWWAGLSQPVAMRAGDRPSPAPPRVTLVYGTAATSRKGAPEWGRGGNVTARTRWRGVAERWACVVEFW